MDEKPRNMRTYTSRSDCGCPWRRRPRRSLCLAQHSSCPWSSPSRSSPVACCSLSPSASWPVSLGQRVHYVGMHLNKKWDADMCMDKWLGITYIELIVFIHNIELLCLLDIRFSVSCREMEVKISHCLALNIPTVMLGLDGLKHSFLFSLL